MERFAELGYATIPATNADRDAAQQITDIQTLINKGAKGLVISVGDADAIVPAIEYANDSSVPIVAIDEAPASGKIAMIVRADNVQMGELACEEMGKRVAADAVVVTLDGDPVTSNGRDRTNGFNDCMASKYPGVKLVNVATEWDPAKAASGIETALNQYGNVAASTTRATPPSSRRSSTPSSRPASSCPPVSRGTSSRSRSTRARWR